MSFRHLRNIITRPKSICDYKVFVPSIIDEILETAKSLKGLKIIHVNATMLGGGVAEMLRSEVSLQKDLGLDASWMVIPPNSAFFEVTKKMHNLLQGQKGKLTLKEQKIYRDYNALIGRALSLSHSPDILLIHDPQPAASASFINSNRPKLFLWRCHIDTTTANKKTWKFMLPYLKLYDHFIFTNNEYVKKDFPPKRHVSFITPVIDPLVTKNILMEKSKAKKIIKKLGIDTTKPLITQVSRIDPWKDPFGVIDAFRIVKKDFPEVQLALVAQSATDDPEGKKLLLKVKDYINNEKGIYLLINLHDNDESVNAFQTASDVILQKSIREGFSLTVTEAMWKGAVVVGGNVGGIKLQIKDGKNGFLVNSTNEAAERIIYILKNPHIVERISQNAHESVKNNFLLPHATLNYLKLFKKLLNH